jgi:hypothetical protein
MSTVVGVLLGIALIIWFFVKIAHSFQKSAQRYRRHDRCEHCNSRLKAVRGRYATTCRKCGKSQSWEEP